MMLMLDGRRARARRIIMRRPAAGRRRAAISTIRRTRVTGGSIGAVVIHWYSSGWMLGLLSECERERQQATDRRNVAPTLLISLSHISIYHSIYQSNNRSIYRFNVTCKASMLETSSHATLTQ